jgi:AP endonuclease-2
MEKPTAVPPNFDAFFSFPHGKGGYSGTCTYVKSSHSVPLKAEEGITGRLLGTVGGNSALPKLVYKEEERIGGYVADGDGEVLDNHDGSTFDLNKLDMEGRAVVLDFG